MSNPARILGVGLLATALFGVRLMPASEQITTAPDPDPNKSINKSREMERRRRKAAKASPAMTEEK